ncbi:MAG: hypothetical protein M1832_006253 [Thelocarpon impressellum]|nr:MAG: hypothetical protein M1832_006253 [Thelocarpon impressellum]
MAASIHDEYPPQLTAEQSEYLISNLKDWAIVHGLAVRPPPSFIPPEIDGRGVIAVPAPVTLIVDVDDFIAKLWEVHLAVKKEGYVQDLSLGLFRSDYMVHVDPETPGAKPEIKQVEFNTIASSFGGLSTRVSELHKHLLSIGAYPHSRLIASAALPPNTSDGLLSDGLAAGHEAYGPSKSSPPLPRCILMLVSVPERNVFDQRPLEYRLRAGNGIPVFRLPFADILGHTSIKPTPGRALIYTPPHSPTTRYEVSVLYFRAGYSPADYPSAAAWTARLHLERSAAIKCPSILTHLAGSKKIQQVLATPSSPHLARFLPDASVAVGVARTFAAIHPLDGGTPAGLAARRLALDPATAPGYVLKPQREGGGNNVYGAAIPPFLRSLPETSWKAYILMELIQPPAQANAILRNGEVQAGGVVGELGVYGVCLWRHGAGGGVLENYPAGHLLRTKGRESEEGGVAAGFGAVDSVLLVDV